MTIHEPCSSRGWCHHSKAGRIGYIAARLGRFAHDQRHREWGQKGGSMSGPGRTSKMNSDPRRHEWSTKGGRAGGRVTGAKNFTREDRIRGGKAGGKATMQSAHGTRIRALGARAGGLASGVASQIRLTNDPRRREWSRKGGSIGGRTAGIKAAKILRNRAGPNRLEAKLYEELHRLGVEFLTEFDLGKGRGLADILCWDIAGELDGGGHFVNFGRRNGISDEQWRTLVRGRDSRHDAERQDIGLTVLRGTNPISLARRIESLIRRRRDQWNMN